MYIDTLKDIIKNTGPDLEVIRTIGKEKGRKWAQDSRHKYFTSESFADAINRTSALDLAYDDLGRPSERGGKLDIAFLRRPRAELSLAEYRYQMNMRTAQVNAISFKGLGVESEGLSAHDTKHCGGRRFDLGFGWRASVVYLEVGGPRDETVWVHRRMLRSRADGWRHCEEAEARRSKDGGYFSCLAVGYCLQSTIL